MGDFSAHACQVVADRTYPIDIDNVESVLNQLSPALLLTLDESLPEVRIEFSELDDFHPDNLFQKLPIFTRLSKLRVKLNNAASFKEGVSEFQKTVNWPERDKAPAASDKEGDFESDRQTLQRLLGDSSPDVTQDFAKQHSEQLTDEFVRNIMADYVVEDYSASQSIYIEAIDEAIGIIMAKILQHPEFKALESAWRSLHYLLSNLDADETLAIHLYPITKAQLAEKIKTREEDGRQSLLFQFPGVQEKEVFGGEPWSLIIGDYSFGLDSDDLNILAQMGRIAQKAACPYIAEARPSLLGCQSLSEQTDYRQWNISEAENNPDWRQLRKSPVAPWIGLVLPRILLRLPYGEQTDPVDCFRFEERAFNKSHDGLLWGNPAFHCALLIARSFLEQGWEMQLERHLIIDDLPALIENDNEESKLKPCAEVLINDSTMEKILQAGIMPFLSHKQANRIRLARFQSIAYPLKALNNL